jgi:hypothetical protein
MSDLSYRFTLTIMMTYKTLSESAGASCISSKVASTHWTAGTRAASGTMAKPSTRTAADCIRAAKSRVPIGILSIVLVVSLMERP